MARTRFVVLDGMRGVAAICVMIYHLVPNAPGGLFYHSYLAVDLFFLLSGFVIAYTYERKLASQLSWSGFAVARVIRLYPLVVAGVSAAAILRMVYPHPALPSPGLLRDLATNALLLPNSLTSPAERFPLVPPSWSLFYELVVNLLYAALLPWLGRRPLIAVTVVAGLALAVLAASHGSVGLLHHDIAAGLVRTVFSFSVGILIYRHLSAEALGTVAIPSTVQYGALGAVLVCPAVVAADWLYDMVAVALIFPVMIGLAVRQTSGAGRIEHELGEMSYPVYVLHMPVAAYVGVALGWTGNATAIAVTASVATLGVSALAWRYYDRPVRTWLGARWRRPAAQHGLRAEP